MTRRASWRHNACVEEKDTTGAPPENEIDLAQLLSPYTPPAAQAYLDASRAAEQARHATAMLTTVAHVAAHEPTDEDLPDPTLADL